MTKHINYPSDEEARLRSSDMKHALPKTRQLTLRHPATNPISPTRPSIRSKHSPSSSRPMSGNMATIYLLEPKSNKLVYQGWATV
jgi:hypothetical protein